MFKEIPKTFNILDRKIEADGKIMISFNKSIIEPSLEIIEPKLLNDQKIIEFSDTRDTAHLWLPEINFDSIKVVVRSQEKALDTTIIRRNKKDTYTEILGITNNLTNGKLKPGSEYKLKLANPIKSINDKSISILEDSIAIKNYVIAEDKNLKRAYTIKYPWKLNKQYIVKLESNTFEDISGKKSKVYTSRFELDVDDNYGSISVTVNVPDTSKTYIIQWLTDDNKILREEKLSKKTVLNYTRYPTAKYKIRVVYDANKNGEWDTGNLLLQIQPEKTWTFEKTITLRPNWDLEENIIIPNPD